MEVAHFYHCWCGGAWRSIAEEHVQALVDAEFDGPVTVGLVGPGDVRDEARGLFRAAFPSCETIEADEGWEPFTVSALHVYAQDHDGAVVYAHTHGAWHGHRLQDRGRHEEARKQFSQMMRRRRDWLAMLESGECDVCGMCDPNFWAARNDYVRCLASPPSLNSASLPIEDPIDRVEIANWVWGENARPPAPFLSKDIQSVCRVSRLDHIRRALLLPAGTLANADLCLVDALQRAMTGVGCLESVAEDVLHSAVRATQVIFPDWSLTGDESEPIRERLDRHFEPMQRIAARDSLRSEQLRRGYAMADGLLYRRREVSHA